MTMKPLALIQFYDSSLVTKLFGVRYYRQMIPVALWISRMGDGWLYLLIGMGAWLTLGWEQGYFAALLLGFAIERPVYYVLKNSLRRDRPFHVLAIKNQVSPSDQFSFPSGHTSAAFMFASITASFFPALAIPLGIWALLVGFSRIVLGVHYPTDVMVGMLMGMSLAQLALA